jgi:RNA polymerase sigma-70 factor (ECF subfamily)
MTVVDAERALVEDAKSGSADAFEALVRRYETRILNYTLAATANPSEAEDVAQEVFIRAYRGLSRFRGESSFKTWIYSIATNAVRTHLARRRKRAPVWGKPPGDDDPGSSAFDVAGGEDLEEDTMRRQAIDRALGELPKDLRLAVILRDIQGLEYREIADITGVPLGTVESRLFRARRRLRPLLAPLVSRGERGSEGEGP